MSGTGASVLYGGLSVALGAAIYWASSLPRVSMPGGSEGGFGLASNLFHLPLYATLSFFLSMSLAGGRPQDLTLRLGAAALILAAAYAALDEWHQSFVPGRTAAVSDFLLDVAGIGGMLLLLHLESRAEVNR